MLWTDLSSLAELTRNPKATAFYVTSADRAGTQVRYTRAEIARLGELARDLRDPARHPDRNDLVKRGALLHADIAMLMPHKGEPPDNRPPPGPRQLVLNTADGRQLNIEEAAVHWELGRTLLDMVAPARRWTGMVAWYLATASHADARTADRTPEHARQLLWRCWNLVHSGCLTPLRPTGPGRRPPAVPPQKMVFDIGSERSELFQAELLFGSALDVDPRLAEAGSIRARD
jgi:hypothetical protein